MKLRASFWCTFCIIRQNHMSVLPAFSAKVCHNFASDMILLFIGNSWIAEYTLHASCYAEGKLKFNVFIKIWIRAAHNCYCYSLAGWEKLSLRLPILVEQREEIVRKPIHYIFMCKIQLQSRGSFFGHSGCEAHQLWEFDYKKLSARSQWSLIDIREMKGGSS